jgi:hypothetical protein
MKKNKKRTNNEENLSIAEEFDLLEELYPWLRDKYKKLLWQGKRAKHSTEIFKFQGE